MRNSWHKSPAPVITAEAIKMQRGNSLDKFQKEIQKLGAEVQDLELKKSDLASVVASAIEGAVVAYEAKKTDLLITEKVLQEQSVLLKEDKDSFSEMLIHVKEGLKTQAKDIAKEKSQNGIILRDISAKERSISSMEQTIKDESVHLEKERTFIQARLNELKSLTKTLDARKNEFDHRESRIEVKLQDLNSKEQTFKLNRESLARRELRAKEDTAKAKAVIQESEDAIDKLRDENAKLQAIKNRNDEMAKTIQASSKDITDRENELKMREKAINAKDKELNKREGYIKIKERGE